jgi:hypothetical protein
MDVAALQLTQRTAHNAKWGPAFLPVPTSVVSLNPLLFQEAIIGLGARYFRLKDFHIVLAPFARPAGRSPAACPLYSMPDVHFRACTASSIRGPSAFHIFLPVHASFPTLEKPFKSLISL